MNQIEIRHVEDEDYEAIAAIYTSEAVIAQTTQMPHRTADFWRGFYRQSNPANVELVAHCDGSMAGHLGILLNQNIRRRHVASFGIVVHPHFHGQGVGKALMAELVNLADNWLNLLKLELSVFSDNKVAIGLYKKFDFVIEGEKKHDTFQKGRYAHSLQMARFHPDHKLG